MRQFRSAIVFMFLNSANSLLKDHVYTLKNQSYSYIVVSMCVTAKENYLLPVVEVFVSKVSR